MDLFQEEDFPYQFQKVYFKTAITLHTSELAWKYKDIFNVVQCIKKSSLAILGGDVLNYIDNNPASLEYTYDSWYLDRLEHQSWDDYVTQCASHTTKYIDNYYKRNGDNFCYVIVCVNEKRFNQLTYNLKNILKRKLDLYLGETLNYYQHLEKYDWKNRGLKTAKIEFGLDGDEVIVQTDEKSPIKRVRRITGYLSNIENFNDAKKAECRDRVVHVKN